MDGKLVKVYMGLMKRINILKIFCKIEESYTCNIEDNRNWIKGKKM